ncbi:MAG: DUF1707 and DUF2154 domain-containing protein [Kofleriaceae bacterium]|nr:DUF1707 and DUF2154 domain-containing protein [Kofleriaceae bacterium]
MSNTLLAERRDNVIEQLSAGYAGDAFEVEELERRLALAHAARTPTELDALVTDLAPGTAMVATSTALVPARRMNVMLGSIEREGPWVVPSHLAARVVWGNLVLDLREAQLGPGITTIDVRCTMGNVEIIVPPAVAVDVDVSSLLANVEERTEPAARSGVRVQIVGRVRFGNLEVSTRGCGESKRDVRRRKRWERRALRRRMRERAMLREWY